MTKFWVKVTLAGLVIATLVTLLEMKLFHIGEYEGAAKLHEKFCRDSKTVIEDDRQAFLSGDQQRQEKAAAHFYDGQALYDSAQSLMYCIPASELPPLPGVCQIKPDWKCLADVAQKIEDKL